MTRRDWWIGVALVLAAIAVHAAFPRYDWRQVNGGGYLVRIDTWRGTATVIRPEPVKP